MTIPLRVVSFLAPSVRPVYQFISNRIGQRLGRPVELLDADTHDQMPALQPDIAFICGLPYIQMMRQNPPPLRLLAAPVLRGTRYGGKPVYFSDIIVHRHSPVQSFADLRGRSWAYNEVVSQSGYGIMRHHLIRIGQTRGYFGKVICAGWLQEAIRMVAVGEVDAAAIDSQVLAIERRLHPERLADIRVIDSLGPSSIQPVVARASLPDSTAACVQEVLLTLADDPAAREVLASAEFERFVAVEDRDYDDIRRMLNTAEALNFMTIH